MKTEDGTIPFKMHCVPVVTRFVGRGPPSACVRSYKHSKCCRSWVLSLMALSSAVLCQLVQVNSTKAQSPQSCLSDDAETVSLILQVSCAVQV